MSKQISIDKIVKATLSGIKQSQKQYEKLSGGRWLRNAPEYIITINVANKISEIDGPQYITLENGSSDTLVDAGTRGRGRLPMDIRENGRVDILLWWGKDTPRAAIELKRYIYDFKQYEKDIKRMKHFLKRNLQFGLLGYFDSAENGKNKSARTKIENKLENIENRIKDILGDGFTISSKRSRIYEIEESAWCALCILIRQKTT